MPKLANRVKETSATTGTGSLTTAGAVTGFVTFNTAYGTGERFPYVAEAGADWEQGIGYMSSSTTLVREVVEDSSNSGALVSFAAAITVYSTPGFNQFRPGGLGHRMAGFPSLK